MKNLFKQLIYIGAILSSFSAFETLADGEKSKFKQKAPIIINTVPIATVNSSPISQAELDQVFGQTAPRPGIYKIRSLLSGLCVGPDFRHGFGDVFSNNNQTSVLQTMNCVKSKHGTTFQHYVAVIPNPLGGYTLRRAINYSAEDNNGNYSMCATVARGVVFGPLAIDFLNCQAGTNATQFNQLGAEDQRFTFQPVSKDVYIIHANNGECLDVRDASQNPEAEIIRWGCNNLPNQKFEFTYLKPLAAGEVKNGVKAMGYSEGIDGLWRANSMPNITFTGAPYSNTVTFRDNGASCKQLCLADNKCVNWVYDASDTAIEPICALRNNFSSPIRANGTVGGSIRH